MAFNADDIDDDIDDDIQIGDHLDIRQQIFIILDITDGIYIISPPSRQHQTFKFFRDEYFNEARDSWTLENTIPNEVIKDWTIPYEPYERYSLFFNWNYEDDTDSDITLIKSEDVKIDYLHLRDILVEYALKDETNESIPFKNYTVSSDPDLNNLYGYGQNLIFNTRSVLGAIITYMDWLDTEKDNIDWSRDNEMWDQQDPTIWSGYINPDGSVRVEELVEEFLRNHKDIVELQEKNTIFGFLFSTQPQIKAVR